MTTKTTPLLLALTLVLGSLAFVPATAHHQATGVDVRFLDAAFGAVKDTADGYGDFVVIEVQDHARTSASSVTVVVSTPSDSAGEQITLRRYTSNSGDLPDAQQNSFFGVLAFEPTVVAGNGRVRAADGETVTVRYTDTTNSDDTDMLVFNARTTGTLVTDATTYFGHDALDATACGSTVGAKLTVTDGDLSSSAMGVARSSADPNDDVTVTLTETGTGTGIFEGRLCFTTENLGNNANRVFVKEGAIITLVYQDAANSQGVAVDVIKSIVWHESSGAAGAFMQPNFNGTAGAAIVGNKAWLRIFDKDRDTTSSADTITAQIQSLQGAGPAGRHGPLTVTLTESGPNTAEFLGSIDLVTVAAAGKLTVEDGDTIQLRYDDPRAADGSDPSLLTIAPLTWDETKDAVLRLVRCDYVTDATDYYGIKANVADANDAPCPLATDLGADNTLAGKLYVRVEDADRSGLGPLTARVTSSLDPIGVEVALAETGASTGIFIGKVLFTTGPAKSATDLLVQDGALIGIHYQDLSAAGTTVLRTDSAVWHRAETGVLSLDRMDAVLSYTAASTKTLGDFATITLIDPDRNLAPGTADTVTVRVATPSLAVPLNEISVTLTEANVNSGVFRGTFGFTTGANDDTNDVLRMPLVGGAFEVEYIDPFNAMGSPFTLAPVAGDWADATLGAVVDGPAVARFNSASFFGTGATANILAFDSRAIPVGGFKVCAKSDLNAAGVTVSLTETATGSKAFKGSIGFSAAASTTALHVANADAISLLSGTCPGTAFAAPPGATWFATADATEVAFTATLGGAAVPSPQREFGILLPVFVRIEDADANQNTNLREIVTVTVGDETLTLLETDEDDGTFLGGPFLFESTAAATNGRVGVATPALSGNTVTLTYSDTRPTTGTSLALTDTLTWWPSGQFRFTDTAGGATVTPPVVGLRTLFVELTDSFFNHDVSTAQTVAVQLLSQDTATTIGLLGDLGDGGGEDDETVILTETGENTNIFRGSIMLAAADATAGNSDDSGTLEVGGGANPRDDTITARVIKDIPRGAPPVPGTDGDVVQGNVLWTKTETGVVLLTGEVPIANAGAALSDSDPMTYVGQSSGFIQVVDAGVNANPAVAETLDVKVSSGSDATGISVTLRETLANSGVFRGRFTFTTGASNDAGDAIKVAHNDPVSVTYTDAKRDDATSGAVGSSNSATWQETSSATMTVDKRKVGGSETLILTITDKDQDTDTSPQTITLPAASIGRFGGPFPDSAGAVAASQTHDIVLTETTGTSGIFRATLSLNDAATTAVNQIATTAVDGGTRVKLTYTEALDASGTMPRAKSVEFFWYDATGTTPSGNGFVQFDASAYPALTSVATVRVTDPDPSCVAGTLSPTVVDTLTVLVVSSSDGRGEVITVTETSVNSRVFTGTVGFESGLVAANGKVGVATGDHVTALYYDGKKEGGSCAGPTSPFFVDRDVARFGVSASTNPTATLSVVPTSGASPLSVNFTVGGSDGDGIVVSYSLAFGDSTTPAVGTVLPATVQHSYTAAGTYNAVLTVTDNSGNTATANVTVTVGSTSSSSSSSSSSTSSSSSSSSSSPSGPLVLTPNTILTANLRVEVTVERDGDDNIISWVLPTTTVAPVLGVQIWSSNSPYALVQDIPASDPDFDDAEFRHTGSDAKATTKYLVTMYYGLSAALGRFVDGSTNAPDTDDYPGTASVDAADDDGGALPTWAIVLIAVGILFLVVLVAVLIARSRNRDRPQGAAQGYAWQEEGEAQAAEGEWQPPAEVHQARCPACSTNFTATGSKPIVTVCPGCGKKGILR